MAQIGRPLREWDVDDEPVLPEIPTEEPQRELTEAPAERESEREKVPVKV